MWTGRQTLASIEQTIARLHQEESRLDGALKASLDGAERLRQARGEALRELARIKLDEIMAGRLERNLDATERHATQLLANGRHRLAAEGERRTAAIAELQQAEATRHAAGKAVEQALEAVERLRLDVEAQLQTSPDWKSRTEELRVASDIAGEAEKKAAQSQAELGGKQKPYDGDTLFVYLWGRKFGTSDYQAGNIARMLDRTVADFIGYADARANYAMLIEIPKRLGEHAQGKRAVANTVRDARADLERRAMIMAGIAPKETALNEARHKLAATEATLESKRQQLKAVDQAREALLGDGAVPGYSQALRTIAEGDSQDEIGQLYAEARRTATPADEAIVRRIEEIDRRWGAIEQDVANLKGQTLELARRRQDIENTRDRFRSAGLDHPHVVFGNETDIGRVLASILEGAVRSGVLWDLIRGGYSTRSPRGRPEFGSPSLPFPFPIPGGGNNGPSGGGWRLPETQGGWFPPANSGDSNSGVSKDRDDFSTGGTF